MKISTFERKILVNGKLVEKVERLTQSCSDKTFLKFCCPEATFAPNGLN